MNITFNSSPEPTLGVELELQVIDGQSLDHVAAASPILEELGHPLRIKHELFESTVEINTDICHTVKQARNDLQEKLDILHGICDREGWLLLSSGTHPFADWSNQVVAPDPRYHRLVENLQWPARQLLIFGIHFHVGVDGPEKAIALQNSIATYMPHFLALSASSPFWTGFDTGLASARTKIFETMPTAGLPYRMDNWHEFLHFMDALSSARAIQTVREVWTDIRPHPGFGTVELRICDATPTLTELATLAAMAQSMVVWLDRRYDSGRPLPLVRPWIVRENKWRAARWGLAADLITDNEGSLKPLLRSIRDLVENLGPIARQLDCEQELGEVETIINRGPSYIRQREVWERSGDLHEVVRSLVDELRTDRFTE
ncbi:MAG: glutamate--cysteine ligase [Actinomycetota bacterium]|nr:glutamate--cysteine ligase [Actinomycetota bacterium]